jgi:hypothetical protein
MMKYVFTMTGKNPDTQYTTTAANWKQACADIKSQNPDCGYIKYISGTPTGKTFDDGDFDDAGKIGKDSTSWRNRKRSYG